MLRFCSSSQFSGYAPRPAVSASSSDDSDQKELYFYLCRSSRHYSGILPVDVESSAETTEALFRLITDLCRSANMPKFNVVLDYADLQMLVDDGLWAERRYTPSWDIIKTYTVNDKRLMILPTFIIAMPKPFTCNHNSFRHRSEFISHRLFKPVLLLVYLLEHFLWKSDDLRHPFQRYFGYGPRYLTSSQVAGKREAGQICLLETDTERRGLHGICLSNAIWDPVVGMFPSMVLSQAHSRCEFGLLDDLMMVVKSRVKRCVMTAFRGFEELQPKLASRDIGAHMLHSANCPVCKKLHEKIRY